MLFSVLVNYINDGIEFTFTRFVDDTEEDRQMWYKKELSQQGLCGLLQRNTSPAHLKQSNHKQQDTLGSVSMVYFITQQQSFDSLSEKKRWLTYFWNVDLTNPICFPSHHLWRLHQTSQERRKDQNVSGDLRDSKPVTMCKVEAFHVQFSFWRCPLQFTDDQSHSHQWLRHKSQVPKADVHQLFFCQEKWHQFPFGDCWEIQRDRRNQAVICERERGCVYLCHEGTFRLLMSWLVREKSSGWEVKGIHHKPMLKMCPSTGKEETDEEGDMAKGMQRKEKN